MNDEQRRLPPGRPPWDPWNGARVGGIAGALIGLVITLGIGIDGYWLVVGGGLVGAGFGFWSEKREQRPENRAEREP